MHACKYMYLKLKQNIGIYFVFYDQNARYMQMIIALLFTFITDMYVYSF